MIDWNDWATPECPSCGHLPMIHYGGVHAFCGNDDCQIFTWDRSLGHEQYYPETTVMEWVSLDED